MRKIYYGKAVYNNKEIRAVNKVLKNNRLNLIDGPHVKKLEKIVPKIFGKKYGLMVNSGSSANLLALASLNFKKGSEIITTSLTFSTTVAPIYQLGLIPNFIGVLENKFIADENQIEKCINKKTVAIMIPNLLGNIADWKKINLIATPDLYQPLKCTLFAKNIFSEFIGLETLKNKETDRVNAVKKELVKLTKNTPIKTYKDHRMAMSFAPMCLTFKKLQINNIEVVSKSYPKFWEDLIKGGFRIYPEAD